MKRILVSLGLLLTGSLATLGTVFALVSLSEFPDVDPNAYYATPLINMRLKGVISGYENGNFGPNDPVTRAQIVTMLDRYDTDVRNMKIIICTSVAREDLSQNVHIYDELCPALAE